MEVSSGARASSLRSKEDTFSSEARLRANAAGESWLFKTIQGCAISRILALFVGPNQPQLGQKPMPGVLWREDMKVKN